jgi:transposase
MRFYTHQHTYYCGVDLHTKTMYLCILEASGNPVLHRNTLANPSSFLKAVQPYRDGLVVGCECIFTWYWLADLCRQEGIAFVLGHALYMKAVHGAKTKNDRKDAHTIASILRGGTFPLAHVYPEQKRPTRDLLRRRTFFVRKRAELLTHIQNTSWQYRLEPIGRRLANRRDRAGVAELFSDESVRASVEADLDLVADYDLVIKRLEQQITKTARIDDARRYDLIRSIPGVGRVLTLVFFYELEGFERFDSVSEFASYSRLIRPKKTSASRSALPRTRRWAMGT